jgi:Domain of unknown function (DUF4265)
MTTDPAQPAERLFQLVFDLPTESPTWPPVSSERVWGAKTAVKFQLAVRNIPFFVRGVALGDVVRAHPDHERQEIVFDEVVTESGHSVFHLLIRDADQQPAVEEQLRRLGLAWEAAADPQYLAVDVRPDQDWMAVREALQRLLDAETIFLQEGTISSHHRSLPGFVHGRDPGGDPVPDRPPARDADGTSDAAR